MLRSLPVQTADGKVEKYICAHWRTFPPVGAGEDIEALRASQEINNEQYSRLKLWERICGLMEMEESKCMTCPHRRQIVWKTRGPYLRSPDGTEVPVVDATTGEASPRNRHQANIFRRPGTVGSYQSAAWNLHAQKAEEEGDG